MRKYRAGIIGCGRIASTIEDELKDKPTTSLFPYTHAGAYREVPKVDLVAAADISEERLKDFSKRWGVESLYTDHEEMLSKENLDIVSISASTQLHYEATLKAVEAGVKAIWCEKPIAECLEDADRMIEACGEAGVKLVINHNRRWDPYYRRAKELVDAGRIGKIQAIVGYMPEPILFGGTHWIDLYRYYGGDVDWVTGHIDEIKFIDPEKMQCYDVQDDAVAFLHFKSEAHGVMILCSKIYLDIIGTNGRIRIGKYIYPFEMWEGQNIVGFPAAMKHTSGMVNAVNEILECIEQNKESISSGRDGRAALEIIAAVIESAMKGGAPVKIPLEDRKLRIKMLGGMFH